MNFQVQEQEVSSQSNAATGALNLTLQQEKLALESRMLNLESLVREKDEVGPCCVQATIFNVLQLLKHIKNGCLYPAQCL